MGHYVAMKPPLGSAPDSVSSGSVGAWSGRLQRRSTGEATEVVNELDDLGYGAVWMPESPYGKNALTFAAVLLGASTRITVATGIAIVWARDPVAMMNAGRTLGDAHPGRFVLGVGISHESTAELRGHSYRRPVAAMSRYLEQMRDAGFDGHPVSWSPPILVAALGPRMLDVAARLGDGAHPFLSTPAHTGSARQLLGPERLLAVEQGVVLLEDLDAARFAARGNLERFLAWPNYRRHFQRMGFGEDDCAGGGSDRLVDALYALGDEEAVTRRVDAHLAAGADHVCLQVVAEDDDQELSGFRRLAPALPTVSGCS